MQESGPTLNPAPTLNRSVASRLLKKSPAAATSATSGPERYAENGHSQEPPAPPRIQLSALDQNIVRLVGQYLSNLGMSSTVSALVAEGGCALEAPAAARFRAHCVAGEWESALGDLRLLSAHLKEGASLAELRFRLLEQRYLEALERGATAEAVRVLQTELSPLGYRPERVHELAALLMLGGGGGSLEEAAAWPGSSPEARRRLVESLAELMPTSVMLPPRRLEALLGQALEAQYSRCRLHNSAQRPLPSGDPEALLSDHLCPSATFPASCLHTATEHCDEIWCARFSHSGRLVASGAKDQDVIIWEVAENARELRVLRRLGGHTAGVCFLAWSPDDRFVAVLAQEEASELWIWAVETGEQRSHVTQQVEDHLSALAWAPDSQSLVVSGLKGSFYHMDLEGQVLDQLEGVRIRSLWTKKDGRTVLGADTHHRIRAYAFEDMSETELLRESAPLIYFCLDETERWCLTTLKGQGLHLWDLESRQLVRRFRGSSHGDYVVLSTFGGVNQDYVASGSEDGNVYIWHRHWEEPVSVLRGHTGVVNAVSWSPTNPALLISASDDGSIRLWGPEPPPTESSAPMDLSHPPPLTTRQALALHPLSGSPASGPLGSTFC